MPRRSRFLVAYGELGHRPGLWCSGLVVRPASAFGLLLHAFLAVLRKIIPARHARLWQIFRRVAGSFGFSAVVSPPLLIADSSGRVVVAAAALRCAGQERFRPEQVEGFCAGETANRQC